MELLTCLGVPSLLTWVRLEALCNGPEPKAETYFLRFIYISFHTKLLIIWFTPISHICDLLGSPHTEIFQIEENHRLRKKN